ncbi:MAG: GAF domain-containing protein [Geobacteraceae bacterium]|nr:GAF domain-containing protein [Geobacteraceae bacterium]
MKLKGILRGDSLTFFFIFLTLASAVIFIGYQYYLTQKARITHEKFQELSAIAGLKSGELADWRKERLADARYVQSNRSLAVQVAMFLKNPGQPDIRRDVYEGLSSIQKSFNYRSVALLDTKAVQRLMAGDQHIPAEKYARALAVQAMRSGEIIFSDIHVCEQFNHNHMDILVPLYVRHDKGRISVGSILLVIDPSRRLNPLIRTWPTLSPTAEALLVRRVENEVVFLNELRHRQGAALRLRFPISAKDLPAALAARGFEGVMQGVDYRGVPVLAAIKQVPGFSWFLVAKVDVDEVLAPVSGQARLTGLIVVVLILLAGLGVLLFWRHGRVKLYKRLYEEERRHNVLAERIECLNRSAYDAILLSNDQQQIIETNEKALEMYGYSREEMLKGTLQELLAPDMIGELEERIREILQKGGVAFECVHRKKDGSFFPTECSVSYLELSGTGYYQSIIRDVSQRKIAENRIARLNRLYHTLSLVNQQIVHCRDRDSLFENVSRILVDEGGLRLAWVGLVEDGGEKVCPVACSWDNKAVFAKLKILAEDVAGNKEPLSGFPSGERRIVLEDLLIDPCGSDLLLSYGCLSGACLPVRFRGRVAYVLTGYAAENNFFDEEIVALFDELVGDLSFALESIEQAEEIRRSEEKYRLLFENMINGFATHEILYDEAGTAVNYRIIDVNPTFELLTGIPCKKAIGELATEVFGSDVAPYLNIYSTVAETGNPTCFETHYAPLERDFSVSVFSPQKGCFATVFTDMTARRKAEEQVRLEEARLQSLLAISQYRARSVQDLLDYALAEAIRLTASKIGYIYFYDPEKELFTLNSWSKAVMKEFAVVAPQSVFALTKAGVWGDAVRFGKPVMLKNYQDYHAWKNGYPPGHVELSSFLTIPVRQDDRIVAVVGVANKDGAYDDADIRQLTLLSDSVWKYAERKRAEDELCLLNEELESRVCERTKDLESFTYTVSHDLRAPLRAISGFSHIIEDECSESLGAEGRRLLNVILENTERMENLINDLLAFSRTARFDVAKKTIDMSHLATKVFEELCSGPDREGIDFLVNELPVAMGDEAMVRQVWLNLLANAVKFSKPMGDVRIRVDGWSEGSENIYSVKDFGVGFDMAYAEKLFVLFQRLHSVSEFEGTGVGLAIVQRIITRHGGRVWAEGELGHGATFYFSLPVLTVSRGSQLM